VRHWRCRDLVRLCWTSSQAWSNWVIGVIGLGGDVSVLEADGKKKKQNPQLDIRATCSFASVLVVPAWSSATGKCSFQLFQRLVHENAPRSRRLLPARDLGAEELQIITGEPAAPHNTCKIHLGLFPNPRYCGQMDPSWAAVRHCQHVDGRITTGCVLCTKKPPEWVFSRTLMPSRPSPYPRAHSSPC